MELNLINIDDNEKASILKDHILTKRTENYNAFLLAIAEYGIQDFLSFLESCDVEYLRAAMVDPDNFFVEYLNYKKDSAENPNELYNQQDSLPSEIETNTIYDDSKEDILPVDNKEYYEGEESIIYDNTCPPLYINSYLSIILK